MEYSDRHDEPLLDDDSVVNKVTDGEEPAADETQQDEEPSHVHIQRPSAA